MAQIGLHTLISLKIRRYLPKQNYFFTFFLIGSILPDTDIIIAGILSFFTSIEYSVAVAHRTFSHSIITTTFLYLCLITLSEFKGNKNIRVIANGIALGIISHILIDLLFWFEGIKLFWPLPISEVNIWKHLPFQIPEFFHNLMFLLEFVFFRLLAYQLIQLLINNPLNQSYYLKPLTLWMKSESYFFITFFISMLINYYDSTILNDNELIIIFGALYIPSLIMSITSIYVLRDNIK